jgi:hypothetical protein
MPSPSEQPAAVGGGMRCDQETRRREQCERTATWTKLEIYGEREAYCTQHANEYDAGGRGRKLLKRWKPVEAAK